MTTPHPDPTISMRPGTVRDVPTIVDFQLRMARETEDLDLDLETVRAGVAAVFEDPAHGTYWVAEQGAEVIGCLLTVPEWSDWRNGEVLWIHSVFVAASARGRGVYAHMYRHLQEHVRSAPGLCGLRLYVDKQNHGAQRAYEALGMTREHYHLYEWLPDG